MKVIEQYFGRPRVPEVSRMCPTFWQENEAYIRVLLNDRYLHVRQVFPGDVPAKEALKICRHSIMKVVERELFGD